MHKYAKFDQSIHCGPRVMEFFTICLRTELMLSLPSVTKKVVLHDSG